MIGMPLSFGCLTRPGPPRINTPKIVGALNQYEVPRFDDWKEHTTIQIV